MLENRYKRKKKLTFSILFFFYIEAEIVRV